jgi:DNA repair exonuclease SbcCD nuclease subunit
MPESLTLLHISDMQFGRNHRFGQLGLHETSETTFDTLFQRLSDDLALLEKDSVRPQIIIVSGDLAEIGKKEEFADALELLIQLAERLQIPRERIVIVPGNHDINRKLSEAYFATCEGEGEEPVKPYWPKWKHYGALFQQFYGGIPKLTFTEKEPWTLYELEDLKVVIAGLNSTMAESHRDDSHYGEVGER